MKTNNEKRKIIKDREFPTSEQINKHQNFDALQGNYSAVQKLLLKKGIIWTSAVVGVVGVASLVYMFAGKDPIKTTANVDGETPKKVEACVTPPIAGQEMPYAIYRISAKDGGILNYPNGSAITIPANAFKNKSGEQVSDSVDIKYREFHTPLDIFLSGIPMEYDSAGLVRTLESAGMIEVRAFDGGKELVLNEETPIAIKMATTSDDPKFNLYELDTVTKNWVYKGKDKIEGAKQEKILVQKDNNKQVVETADNTIRPIMADPQKFSFTIRYERNEFPELAAYDNVKFEVTGHNFKPNYYKINWKKIGLENGETKGNYILALTKADTTIFVEARPVFDKANYEEALQKFEAAHKTAAKANQEKNIQEQKAVNQVNKELATYNPKQLIQTALSLVGINATFRGFEVRSLGYHNIDFPTPPILAFAYKMMANSARNTKNIQQQPGPFNDIYVATKGINTVFRFKRGEPVRCNPDRDNLMWTVKNNQIAFFRIGDYSKLVNGGENNIDPEIAPNQDQAFKEIRKFSL